MRSSRSPANNWSTPAQIFAGKRAAESIANAMTQAIRREAGSGSRRGIRNGDVVERAMAKAVKAKLSGTAYQVYLSVLLKINSDKRWMKKKLDTANLAAIAGRDRRTVQLVLPKLAAAELMLVSWRVTGGRKTLVACILHPSLYGGAAGKRVIEAIRDFNAKNRATHARRHERRQQRRAAREKFFASCASPSPSKPPTSSLSEPVVSVEDAYSIAAERRPPSGAGGDAPPVARPAHAPWAQVPEVMAASGGAFFETRPQPRRRPQGIQQRALPPPDDAPS